MTHILVQFSIDIICLFQALPDHIVCADSLPGFRKLLQTTRQVEGCNDRPTATESSSISHHIQPLCSDMKTTDYACPKPTSPTLGCQKKELYSNDYDEALCLLFETVETLPVSEYFDDADDDLCCAAVDTVERMDLPEECKVINLDSPAVKKNEVNLLQNVLEKTPDRPITVGRKYPYEAAGNITPRVQTPRSINGNKSCLNSSHQVRKRLSFFSEKKSQNAASGFRLDDVYRFLLKKDAVNSHRAEQDALNLLECIVKMGQSFTDWVDENAVQFSSIEKMS
jgi:hypothetical protein